MVSIMDRGGVIAVMLLLAIARKPSPGPFSCWLGYKSWSLGSLDLEGISWGGVGIGWR